MSAIISRTLIIEIYISCMATILEQLSDSTFTTGHIRSAAQERKRMPKHRCAYKTCHDSFSRWQTVTSVWLNSTLVISLFSHSVDFLVCSRVQRNFICWEIHYAIKQWFPAMFLELHQHCTFYFVWLSFSSLFCLPSSTPEYVEFTRIIVVVIVCHLSWHFLMV